MMPVLTLFKARPSASFFVTWVFYVITLAGCNETTLPVSTSLAGATMGTTYHITVVNEVDDPATLNAAVGSLLADINQSMSTYIADSELNRLNQAEVKYPFEVSTGLCEVLTIANQVYILSDGAFDPTIGPLVDLWGFGPELSQSKVPDQQLINARLVETGFDQLVIDCDNLTVTKNTNLRLDLSAIAKGYAVDRVAALMAEKGFTDYMVEIGGEVKVAGLNSRSEKWHIAVEKPALYSQQVQKILSLTNTGLATSGDYRNYFEVNGVHYSHTINPETGFPVTHNMASATVIDGSVARADALATAFLVLGQEKSMKIAEQQNISALFLVKQNGKVSEYATSKFNF